MRIKLESIIKLLDDHFGPCVVQFVLFLCTMRYGTVALVLCVCVCAVSFIKRLIERRNKPIMNDARNEYQV